MTGRLNQPSRALIAYAVLAERIISGSDLVQSLMPFFKPIAASFAGDLFDVEKFCQEVRLRYGLDVPKLAALGWCDRLAKEKLLEEHSKTTQGVIYRYPSSLNAAYVEESDALTEGQVLSILARFRGYARATLPNELSTVSDGDLDEAFYSRLMNIDSMRILTRKESKSDVKATPKTLSIKSPSVSVREQLEMHIDFLVAEYLVDLKHKSDPTLQTISAIAFANMAAEAIATFREPISGETQDLSRVRIYLDTPLALDLFELNDGFESYSQELWGLIQGSDASVAVFDHTVEEIQSVIFARLSSLRSGSIPFRTHLNDGFLVNRLAVLNGNVATKLEEMGIAIDRDPEISLLRISQSALGTIQTDLDRKMGGWRSEARHYDEKSVFSIISQRNGGGAESNFVKCGAVLLTRNTPLTYIGNAAWRQWLTEAGRESRSKIDRAAPIVISDKQFAGLIWMLKGGAAASLSHERIVAHCSSAIRPRSDVIAKVCNLIIEAHGRDKGEEFAALLTNRRAEQALMHAATGDPEVITNKYLPEIIERVTLAAGEAAANAARAVAEVEKNKLKEDHAKEIDSRENLIRAAQGEAEQVKRDLQSANLQAEMERKNLMRSNISLKISTKEAEKLALLERLSFLQTALSKGGFGYRFARHSLFTCYMGLVALGATLTDWPLLGGFLVLATGAVGFWYAPQKWLDPICHKNGILRLQRHLLTRLNTPIEKIDVNFQTSQFLLADEVEAQLAQVNDEIATMRREVAACQ